MNYSDLFSSLSTNEVILNMKISFNLLEYIVNELKQSLTFNT